MSKDSPDKRLSWTAGHAERSPIAYPATAFGGDRMQGQLELSAAIATQAVEYVAGETLGMDAHQGRATGEVAHRENHSFLHGGSRDAGNRSFESENSEVSETGGKIGFGHFANIDCWG